MNKTELTDTVAELSGLTKADSARAITAITDAITSALAAGDSVALTGFGTFSVKAREARTGRNPSTGKEISIPASKSPGFKAGKTLKDAVN